MIPVTGREKGVDCITNNTKVVKSIRQQFEKRKRKIYDITMFHILCRVKSVSQE